MRNVSLHDTMDTPSHTPAHTRLLEHMPPYNRLCALVFITETDDKHFHFRLSSEGHRHAEVSPQAMRWPRIPPCFGRPLLDVSHTSERLWYSTIAIQDSDRSRWVRRQSQSPSSVARSMSHRQPRWHYLSRRSKCMVSSQDPMTSPKSQQQTRPLQRRPLSKTGWIAMVLPDWLSCSAWNRGYKRNTRSSTMRRPFGKS